MTRLFSFRELNNALGTLKRGVSNCIDIGYLERQSDAGNVYIEQSNTKKMVFVDEKEYYRLYYFLLSEEPFVFPYCKKEVVCETFFRKEEGDFSFLKESGFNFYAAYHRRVRKSELETSKAGISATEETLEIVKKNFDKYADYTMKNIEQFLEENYELRTSDNKGVLVYDVKNKISTLKYFYVDKDSRNEGIGGKLLRKYLECVGGNIHKYILWVNDNNEPAIHLYEKYGYRPDGMKKIVWKKDGESHAN